MHVKEAFPDAPVLKLGFSHPLPLDKVRALAAQVDLLVVAEEVEPIVENEIKAAGIDPQVAEVTMIPQNSIKLEGADAKSMLKLYDAIDDHDDVQKVYANFDIDESEMQ
jgi:transcriptional/translational regulatory protein YebC/TACO1